MGGVEVHVSRVCSCAFWVLEEWIEERVLGMGALRGVGRLQELAGLR